MTASALVPNSPWVGTFAHIMAVTTAGGSMAVDSRGLIVSNIAPLHMHSTLNHIIVDKTNLEKGNFTANDHLKQEHIAADFLVNRYDHERIKSLLSRESHLFPMKIDHLHHLLFLSADIYTSLIYLL